MFPTKLKLSLIKAQIISKIYNFCYYKLYGEKTLNVDGVFFSLHRTEFEEFLRIFPVYGYISIKSNKKGF